MLRVAVMGGSTGCLRRDHLDALHNQLLACCATISNCILMLRCCPKIRQAGPFYYNGMQPAVARNRQCPAAELALARPHGPWDIVNRVFAIKMRQFVKRQIFATVCDTLKRMLAEWSGKRGDHCRILICCSFSLKRFFPPDMLMASY
jgi:hypothetical protein